MILALITGLGLGLLGLFPGFHFAMVLLAAGPWLVGKFTLTDSLLAMVVAVVTARAMHTLAVVYHPVAADQLASADPAQRLAARKQGRLATQIMGEGLWLGTMATACVVGLTLFAQQVVHADLIKPFLQICLGLAPLVFLGWVAFLLGRARRKLGTLLVMVASGLLGLIALTHPAVTGSTNAMTPLLTGLFGVPVLLLALLSPTKQSKSRVVRPLLPLAQKAPAGEVTWSGLVAGFCSVIIPGLGTSSIVSLFQDLVEDDIEYLKMASIAESFGETLALILGILMISFRSSDAAVIQRIITTSGSVVDYALSPAFPYLLLGILVISCWISLGLTSLLGIPYRLLLAIVPNKIQAGLVLTGMTWIVATHTGGWGIAIMLAGTLIHLGARKLGTPNQAFFMCLVAPMGLSMILKL